MRKLALSVAFGLAFALPLFAQGPPPDAVPFDPVSWVLLGAAGLIGGKKYYDSRKKDNEQP